MTSTIVLATKRCITCGEDKSLSEYHRNRSRKDGRQNRCKVCATAATIARNARVRAEVGDDEYKAHRRELTAKSRKNPKRRQRDKLCNEAYRAALQSLKERHLVEFEALLATERASRGL